MPKFTIPTAFAANGNYPNNTYRMLRVIEEGHNWAYGVWCTGERELYDMNVSAHRLEYPSTACIWATKKAEKHSST